MITFNMRLVFLSVEVGKVTHKMDLKVFLIIFFIQFFITTLSGFPIENEAEVKKYLQKYGYVGRTNRILVHDAKGGSSDTSTSKALKMFQRVMHINQSGILDRKTLEMMNHKRCGNPDMVQANKTSAREKRYNHNPEGRKWNQPEITYRILRYPSDSRLNVHIINDLTTRAFQMWQEAVDSQLRFINMTGASSTGPVDIEIRFVAGSHNDNDPFDGPGEVLAHAFPPGGGIYGDIHVDEEEDWDLEGKFNGSNFFWVIIHEIGHSLGLSHSMAETAIMAAIEPDFDPNLKLHRDDVEGLLSLYSLKERVDNSAEQTSDPDYPADEPLPASIYFAERCKARPDPCSLDFRISAATVLENGDIYLFSGCYAIHVSNVGRVMGIHRSQALFKGLINDNVDAAITTLTGHTYFFEGKQIRRYMNFKEERERGRALFGDFRDPIDAGFLWKTHIYLIVGKKFFILDRFGRHRSSSGLISSWGVPDAKIDAALVIHDQVYLFRQDHFWALRERNGEFQVDRPTPRSTRTEFLRC